MLINDRIVLQLCHLHVYLLLKRAMPVLTPQPQIIATLWLILIFVPLRIGGRVGLVAWLRYRSDMLAKNVAVNAMDKLLFLIFIFAALLPITIHFYYTGWSKNRTVS